MPALLPSQWSGYAADATAWTVRATTLVAVAVSMALGIATVVAVIITCRLTAGEAARNLAVRLAEQSPVATAGRAIGAAALACMALACAALATTIRAAGLATTTGVVMQAPRAEGHQAC